jgi:hypothetical protein
VHQQNDHISASSIYEDSFTFLEFFLSLLVFVAISPKQFPNFTLAQQHVSNTNRTNHKHIHSAAGVGWHRSIVPFRHTHDTITTGISLSSYGTLAFLTGLSHLPNRGNYFSLRLRLSRLQRPSHLISQLHIVITPACCEGKARTLPCSRSTFLQHRTNHQFYDTNQLCPYQEE